MIYLFSSLKSYENKRTLLKLWIEMSSNIMQALKKPIHYRSTTLATHGISTIQIFDGCSHISDGHVHVVVLE